MGKRRARIRRQVMLIGEVTFTNAKAMMYSGPRESYMDKAALCMKDHVSSRTEKPT